MALPQIQQARIIQAPGVFDYAMREGPRLAEAFTAGLAAGQRARDSKQRAKEVETARGDRLAERNQALLERFGADAVMDPESGTVDVTRSAGAMRERGNLAKLAEQAGEVEAMGMSMADLPPQARELPEYKAGLARGLAKSRQEEMMLNRIGEREKAMLNRQKEIEQIYQQGLTERQQMGDSADFVRALLSPRGGAGAGAPPIRVVERPDGTSTTTRTFRTEEERKAYEDARARESGNTGDLGPDPDYTKAAREAIREYEILKSRGKGADIDFDKSGIPKVTPSRFWDTANDEVIDALRRKVNPRGQPTGRAPSSTGRSPVPVGDVIKGLPQSQPASGSPPAGTSTSIDEVMGMWPASQGSVGDLYSRRPASAGSEIPRDPPEAELWRLLGQSGLMSPPVASRPSMTPEELLARELRDQGLLPPLISRVNLGPMSEQERARTRTRGQLTPEQEAMVERLVRAREPYGGLPPDKDKTMAELLGLDLKPRNK